MAYRRQRCSCGHELPYRPMYANALPLLVRRPDLLDLPSVEALRNRLARWSV